MTLRVTFELEIRGIEVSIDNQKHEKGRRLFLRFPGLTKFPTRLDKTLSDSDAFTGIGSSRRPVVHKLNVARRKLNIYARQGIC